MGIIDRLPPKFSSTLAAAEVIEQKVRNFQSPPSLVQIGLEEGDHQWLLAWAQDIGRDGAYRWPAWTRRDLNGNNGALWSGQEAIGTVLMALFTEVARRTATEGEIWPVLKKLFKTEAARELFVSGQPHSDVRHALEAAARRLRIRHAFGLEGTQSWYVTLYLQFGFTWSAIHSGALKTWLEGATPSISVGLLLQQDSEFKSLWSQCKKFAEGNLPEQSFLSQVRKNNFLLPDWEAALLRALKAEGRSPVQAILVWTPPSAPHFQIRLQNLVSEGFSDSGYDIYLQGEHAAQLLREEDGSYSLDQELSLPLGPPQVSLQLIGHESESSRDFSLESWTGDEGFAIFDLSSGLQLSPRKGLSRAKSYAILAPRQLNMRPSLSQPYRTGGLEMDLHLLPAGREENATLFMGDAVFWSEASTLAVSAEARCLGRGPFQVGDLVEVSLLGLPKDAQDLRVWWRGRPLETRPDRVGWDVKFPIPEDIASSSVTLAGAVRTPCGPQRFAVSALIPIRSAAFRRGADWNSPPAARMTVRDVQTSPWRLVFPDPEEKRAVLEGCVFSARVGSGTRTLGSPAGFGAPLCLRAGPYNSPDPGVLLAREVVWQGSVLAVSRRGRDALIRLAHPIEASDGAWQIVVLDSAGSHSRAQPSSACSGHEWPVRLPEGPVALGLAFAGRLLGSWCDPDWQLPKQAKDARTLAGLLRWMHLPLLRPSLLKGAKTLALAHPAEFLAAWLKDREVKGLALEHGSVTEEWFEVVRACLRNWEPSPDFGADRLVGRLRRFEVTDPYPIIQEIHPALLARVARAHLEWNGLVGPAARKPLIEQAGQLLGLRDVSNERHIRTTRDELIESSARTMQVDPNFVRLLLRRFGPTRDNNLELALAVRPFRQVAAADLLLRLGGKEWN